MKFVSVRELRNTSGRLWSTLAKEDVVLISNGKPMGILIGVDATRLDETVDAIRKARATLAVSRKRKNAAEIGLDKLPMSEIDREVRKVRRRPSA